MARSDKTRPAELVGLSALAGGFVGGVVLLVTRDTKLAAIAKIKSNTTRAQNLPLLLNRCALLLIKDGRYPG